MPETFHNYIGGRWVPARSGRTFHNLNPATGEMLGEFPASGPPRTSTPRSRPPRPRAAPGG